MPTDRTKDEILDAAEGLFAVHGFDGVSIRQITKAAGVNVAAVHYHFGSKEAVLRGVTDRVAGPINDRREELLRKVTSGEAVPELEDLLDAFIRADIEILLELQGRGTAVARFLGRTYSDQTAWIQEMALEQFSPASGLLPAFLKALPHLNPTELGWRISLVVAVIVQTFATWPEEGMDAKSAEALLGRLVTFLTAGLRAPVARSDPSSPRGGQQHRVLIP